MEGARYLRLLSLLVLTLNLLGKFQNASSQALQIFRSHVCNLNNVKEGPGTGVFLKDSLVNWPCLYEIIYSVEHRIARSCVKCGIQGPQFFR